MGDEGERSRDAPDAMRALVHGSPLLARDPSRQRWYSRRPK
jgi:hypothetical protein